MSYQAGTATICITPAEPLWLAGYAVRTAPARGKLSDLHAAALALEDAAGQRFVIASADVIAVDRTIAAAVADAVGVRHDLARQQLLLTATHTHYAPEFRADKQIFFNIPNEYGIKLPAVADKLVATLVEVIDRALANLEPVRLFARKTSTGFAHNRRRRGVKDGNPSTEDRVDHDVPVLDCIDGSGSRKAIVFGYACHNTTIPPEDLRYSGDWAGFAKEQLQQANPAATALFIPGAGADQDPEPRGSVELSRNYGRQIADAVLDALDKPGVEITGPIRTAMADVPLAMEHVSRSRLDAMLARNDDPPQQVKARSLVDALDRGEALMTSYPAPVQVVRFGSELLLVALGGEPVVDWAHKFKLVAVSGAVGRQRNGLPLVWVAGYCNDMFGYLPTRRVQAEGGYEGGRANLWNHLPAPFTADVEERITKAVSRLIDCVCDMND